MWLSLIWKVVGSRTGKAAGIALAVGLTLFFTIQYIRSAEEDRIKLKLIEQEVATEEEINDAINNSPSDPDSILEWLRKRKP